MVVLSVLDVVPTHDLDLAQVRILLPLPSRYSACTLACSRTVLLTLRKSTFLRSFCS